MRGGWSVVLWMVVVQGEVVIAREDFERAACVLYVCAGMVEHYGTK